MNVELMENFSQVCVWEGTLVGTDIKEFEKFMLDTFRTRVQYLEEIKTGPDILNGKSVHDTGGRNDLFFAIHNDDVMKFAIPRLEYRIRWIEDVLAPGNYRSRIYPKRVFAYCSRRL